MEEALKNTDVSKESLLSGISYFKKGCIFSPFRDFYIIVPLTEHGRGNFFPQDIVLIICPQKPFSSGKRYKAHMIARHHPLIQTLTVTLPHSVTDHHPFNHYRLTASSKKSAKGKDTKTFYHVIRNIIFFIIKPLE